MRVRALLAAGAVAIAALYPALAQQGPESILPPGFGDPPAEAPPADAAPPPVDLLPGEPSPSAEVANTLDAAQNALDETEVATVYELPPEERRSLDNVGLVADESGFEADSFGSDGAFLSTLARRLDAPLASRWAAILLRRALVAQSNAGGVDGADWAADRAWLLVRMGEADAARALVQRVDPENYTPWLYTVAMQAALASADPAAICGFADGGALVSRDAAWLLGRAICAGLAGESLTAQTLVREARRERAARGFDVLAAEKVIGAGVNTRRAVTLQWEGVDTLTAWRFGMTAATGVAIPPAIMQTAGAQVRAWHARAPLFPASARLASADRAATLGVFSHAALIDFYGVAFDEIDIDERRGTIGEILQRAHSGDDRVSALQELWRAGDGNAYLSYARAVLTARASAMLAVDGELSYESKDRLLAAMFSAGFDTRAQRWAGTIEQGSLGWALLAAGSPAEGQFTRSEVADFAEGNEQRGRFLLAALAGLGRLSEDDAEALARDYRVPIGRGSSWTRALQGAVAARQRGRVALLVAAGLQTPLWEDVPPETLFHIVRSLRLVGLGPAARMIAAEALTRS